MSPGPADTKAGATAAERRLSALLATTERLAQIGSWEWWPASGELTWSENLFRLLGFEPGEVSPHLRLFFERLHPDDRERVEKEIEFLAHSRSPRPPFEYRLVHPAGTVRHLRTSTALVEPAAEGRRLVGSVQDLTDDRLAAREIAAHIAATGALAEWESLEQGSERLLRALGEAMGFIRGALWVVDDSRLVARALWEAPSLECDRLRSEVERIRLPPGVGMAGEAWAHGGLVHITDLTRRPRYAFLGSAEDDGIRGAIALPAVCRHEVVAVLGFSSREEVQLTDRLVSCLRGIGAEVGQFLSRRRGELTEPLLTSREVEVLQLVADGGTAPRIAEQLVLSTATVKTHLENIYKKLDVGDRAAAVARGLRQGMIE